MKGTQCSLIITLLLIVCSCGSTKVTVTHTKKDIIVPVGTVTEKFKEYKWLNYENVANKAEFQTKTILNFDQTKATIVNIYDRNSKTIETIENEKGIINYYKFDEGTSNMVESTFDEAIDENAVRALGDNEELWGFQDYKDFLVVIKNTGTVIYKNGNVIFECDGTAKIEDIDNDKIAELVTRSDDGSKLDLYKFIDDKFMRVWEYISQKKELDGAIQIGDLNGDGIKEIYVGDSLSTERKFVITKDGIGEDFSLLINKNTSNSEFYIVDYNQDGKMDIITVKDGEKPILYIHE